MTITEPRRRGAGQESEPEMEPEDGRLARD